MIHLHTPKGVWIFRTRGTAATASLRWSACYTLVTKFVFYEALRPGALWTGKTYCPAFAKLQQAESPDRIKVAGAAALARLRAERRDPSHGGKADRQRKGKAATQGSCIGNRKYPRHR